MIRSVPQDVRSLAMAFTSFLVNLLSQAPSTIVVGSVIDSACLLWNNVCGRQGACLLYDASALRIRYTVKQIRDFLKLRLIVYIAEFT